MSGFNFWETGITYLKKVGPKRATVLEQEAGIKTYGDLLHYFPRKYIDKSQLYQIRQIRSDVSFVTLIGKIDSFELIKGKKGSRLIGYFSDESGELELIWFKGIRWVREKIKEGQEIVVFGSPRFFGRKAQIAHPEVEILQDRETYLKSLKIVPDYPSTEKLKAAGLDSKGIRGLMTYLLEIGTQDLRESLSPSIMSTFRLMRHKEAFLQIHFPDSFDQLREAQRRLKFEELFFFQLLQAQRRLVEQPRHPAFPFPKVGDYFNTFFHEHLPFELTGAQKRVIKEIRRDLSKATQMNRLVQGDVGSGKTIVAFMIMLIALDNGFQATMMAPTEILAEQHYNNLLKYGGPLGLRVGFLSGSVRGAARKQLLFELEEGHVHILVGTHAVIEDPVRFQSLALVVVDEQHKFGVLQRAKLLRKAPGFPARYPHNLAMTATPIPRTLAMTVYGDMDGSRIDELPPGRTPVITAVRGEGQRLEVFGFIKRELSKGRQAYIVYPLVEESEKLDYLAVTEGYEAISRAFPKPDYQVGIIHGRMKPEDKEQEMQRFKKHETNILVATTVIEVGVDVPNATLMVIENAEKFGLSQLHQLRGRVGRGGEQSYCILMVGGKKTSEEAKKRLRAMVNTTDGFEIARFDLRLRGPGDFLGTRQSGIPEFKLAHIVEDETILMEANAAATELVETDPDFLNPENLVIKQHYLNFRAAHMRKLGFAR